MYSRHSTCGKHNNIYNIVNMTYMVNIIIYIVNIVYNRVNMAYVLNII